MAGTKEVAKVHYNASEWTALRRRVVGSAVDAGATSQEGSIVTGSTEADLSHERELVSKLRSLDAQTGGSVSSTQSLDTGIVSEAERVGALRPATALFRSLGTIGVAVGAFEIGWKIGSGLRELFGLEGEPEREAEHFYPEEIFWRSVCETAPQPECYSYLGNKRVEVARESGQPQYVTAPTDPKIVGQFWHWPNAFDISTDGIVGMPKCAKIEGKQYQPEAPSGYVSVVLSHQVFACYSGEEAKYVTPEAAYLRLCADRLSQECARNQNGYVASLPAKEPPEHNRREAWHEITAPPSISGSPALPDIATEKEGKGHTPEVSPNTTTYIGKESPDLGTERLGEVRNPA